MRWSHELFQERPRTCLCGKIPKAPGNFCTAKDKEGGAGQRSSGYKSDLGGNYAIPDFTRGCIGDGPLRADYRQLSVLYWAARASNVLMTPGTPKPGKRKQNVKQVSADASALTTP